jgi:hypothetical protein
MQARSAWLGARILSILASDARTGALLFLDHLTKLTPQARTLFDESVLDDETLMEQLTQFSEADPPVLVWRNNGRYQYLFRFLAMRFLSCPDSVLDVEGVHAQWKWISIRQRATKFKMLNAVLKIKHFVNHFGGLPDYDDIRGHMQAVQQGLWEQYKACTADDVVAKGLRSDFNYRGRFNLRGADIDLLKEAIGGRRDPAQTPQMAWGMYVRFLFEPNTFYSFLTLDPDKFLFIAQNKSLPGRDERAAGETLGRPLSVAWFERVGVGMDGVQVKPVSLSGSALTLMVATMAEISRAAGYYPAVDEHMDARTVELKHEATDVRSDVHVRIITFAVY